MKKGLFILLGVLTSPLIGVGFVVRVALEVGGVGWHLANSWLDWLTDL